VIGLGGSATNDCGLGMLMALGVKAFDAEGEAVQPNLAGLLTIESIDITGLDARLAESRLTVLSDVVSPLCGKNGATSVYGPQKGVREGDVERINAAMARFAELCGRPGLANEPGAGAAGGLGFAMRLMGGELVSGGDYVIEKVRLREQLQGAVWVITGEGRSDAQTLQGKLPLKVAQAARSAGAKVALISGAVDEAVRPELEKEFDLVIGVSPDAMAVEQALQCAEALLSRAVQGSADRFMLR